MALPRRFNPPPNWPAPPPGWVPPPNWQPDPAWGPPPEGWPLWVQQRANPKAFGWAFAFAGGYFLLALVIGLIGSRGRISGYVVGSVMPPFLLAGLIAGIIAWTRPVRWSWWMYALVVFLVALALTVLSGLGRQGAGG